MKEAAPKDIATIIYTSGATGESKGVVLHHANFREVFRIHDIRLPQLNDQDVTVCFLPLTHIFEKAWSSYCLHKGITIAINRNPKKIQQTLQEIRPTLMCNVPRFWEKVYTGVQDKIASSSGCMQRIFADAIRTGHAYKLEYKNKGLRPPAWLTFKFNLYNQTVYRTLKKVLGIEKGRLFPVGGAPLADKVNIFLQAVNIPIITGYGSSETAATICFCPDKHFIIGSIGTLMPGVELRIDPENSEILVKGKTITSGYYKKPEENARAFTPDGYFRTGDAGYLEGNTLFFTERIKDLYKTSNGKYIAPQAIEGMVGSDKYIHQIAVIGDKCKFVSALIVPDMEELEKYALKKHLAYTTRKELVNHLDIYRMLESRIEEHQKNLASYEKIKKFVLLAQPFTMESEELTDALKLRRRVILKNYATQIEEMYQE